MKNDYPSIEDQLRRYADAIDPAMASSATTTKSRKRRGPSIKATWLAAAAALLILGGFAALSQRDTVQVVETGDVAQQPDSSPNPDSQIQVPDRTDPIYWPGGTTDAVESVELFLDEWFAPWRSLALLVISTEDVENPIPRATTTVEVRRPDGELFATVPLRFSDGRWFLEEIASPLVDLELFWEVSGGATRGYVTASAAGDLEMVLIYSAERTVELTSGLTVADEQVGIQLPVVLQQSHQEVHATLVSPQGELLAFVAFTAPPGNVPVLQSAEGCVGCPATGDLRTREQSMAVMMAEQVLMEECLAERGVAHQMPTQNEWIELFGSWRPNGILGIGAEGAARRIGYQSDGWGGAGSPSQSRAFNTLSDAGRETYAGHIDECWPVVAAALGDHQNRMREFDQILQLGSDGTQGERFRSDPILATAIEVWQQCVRDTVNVDADTPNTLARKFAFTPAANPEREREVAVADVRCQQQADLEHAFYVARTTQLRSELGENLAVFDDYVRFRQDTVWLAEQVLADRGIVPPTLD